MRLAIALHDDHVSTALDFAAGLLLVELESGRETSRRVQGLAQTLLPARAGEIARLDPDVLICGAVSRPLWRMLCHEDIEVISGISGQTDEVLRDFLGGCLENRQEPLPGWQCGGGQGRRRRCRGGRW